MQKRVGKGFTRQNAKLGNFYARYVAIVRNHVYNICNNYQSLRGKAIWNISRQNKPVKNGAYQNGVSSFYVSKGELMVFNVLGKHGPFLKTLRSRMISAVV